MKSIKLDMKDQLKMIESCLDAYLAFPDDKEMMLAMLRANIKKAQDMEEERLKKVDM